MIKITEQLLKRKNGESQKEVSGASEGTIMVIRQTKAFFLFHTLKVKKKIIMQ